MELVLLCIALITSTMSLIKKDELSAHHSGSGQVKERFREKIFNIAL